MKLSCELFLVNLLERLNQEFKPNWIFTLGIYNPERHKLLEEYNVWGADYKGWIFEYEEDYSFVKNYIEAYNIPKFRKTRLKKLLDTYSYLKKIKLSGLPEFEKKTLKEKRNRLRRIIDNTLKKENLSLQYFRFLRIRENLKKKLIEKNMKLVSYSLYGNSRTSLESSQVVPSFKSKEYRN